MNKLAIFFLPFFLLGGCSNAANADKDTDTRLNKAYEALNIASLGLNYPASQKILDDCIKNNDRSCLKAYNRVQDGKNAILNAIKHDEALVLRATLNRITSKCNDNKKMEDDVICIGAIVSLYFFDKEKHQQQIMEALRIASNISIDRVFATKYEWMCNRPDPEQWMSFVNSLPDDQLSPLEKKIAIEDFEKSKKNFEKFGVML